MQAIGLDPKYQLALGEHHRRADQVPQIGATLVFDDCVLRIDHVQYYLNRSALVVCSPVTKTQPALSQQTFDVYADDESLHRTLLFSPFAPTYRY